MEANNKSLFTFSFKAILLILLGWVILKQFILPFAPGMGSDPRYLFALKEMEERNINKEYQIGFFGNSYSYTSLDPSLIKSKLGLNALHINTAAQNLRVSLITAKELLSKNDLKYMFFDISDLSLETAVSTDKKKWYYQARALRVLPLSFDKIKYTWNYFPKIEQFEYFFASISDENSGLSNLNKRNDYKFIDKYKYKYDSYFTHNGYVAQKKKRVKKEFFVEKINEEPHIQETKAFWTESLVEQFDDFASLAESKGTQITLTHGLKIYPTLLDIAVIEGLMSKYNNIKYLDFNSNRDDYMLIEKGFYNETHYNYPLSYQVTNRLIDSISKWYKIPFQTKKKIDFKIFELSDFFFSINDAQDKFFRIEYDSLPPIELKEYQLVVSFYPKDKMYVSPDSKKNRIGPDNFYFNLFEDYETMGNKKVILKKMSTKINHESMDKILIYFFKQNDTLNLPSFKITNDK